MRWATCLALALLGGCHHLPHEVPADCSTGEVRLLAAFSQAGAGECVRLGPASFGVTISPETRPINPSPWYAFDIAADDTAEVEAVLRYDASRHRYQPKRSDNGGAWVRLPESDVQPARDGVQVKLNLSVPTGRTRVAAQEVFDVDERKAWVEGFASRASSDAASIGKSIDGRDLLAIRLLDADRPKPLVIILGGQHPPEVPGVIGLRAFINRLVMDHNAITRDFGFLIVPELNPDGVERGHWRTNAGLVDLNRDWGPFTQPETRAVRDEIANLVELGFTPVLLLDFHATRRNIFYLPEPDSLGRGASFAAAWLAAIDAIWPGDMPEGRAGHNPDNPTAKTWFTATFAAPAITVEYGDEVDRGELRDLAEASADALAGVLPGAIEKETRR